MADLTSSMQDRVEIVWQGSVPTSIAALGAECHLTGDTVRAVLPAEKQDAAIEILRREKLRLISVVPVRATLEDYFLQKLKPAATPLEVMA